MIESESTPTFLKRYKRNLFLTCVKAKTVSKNLTLLKLKEIFVSLHLSLHSRRKMKASRLQLASI